MALAILSSIDQHRSAPAPARHSPHQKQQGFSLIELVMTMTLIAILSAVVMSRWSATTFDVQSAAELLVADIRYTQKISMTRGERFRINFQNNRYWITTRTGNTAVPNPGTNQTIIYLNNGIRLSSRYNRLVFDGNGAPYTSTNLPGTPLTGNATITLSVGTHSRTIQISPTTGRVTLL